MINYEYVQLLKFHIFVYFSLNFDLWLHHWNTNFYKCWKLKTHIHLPGKVTIFVEEFIFIFLDSLNILCTLFFLQYYNMVYNRICLFLSTSCKYNIMYYLYFIFMYIVDLLICFTKILLHIYFKYVKCFEIK